MEPRPGPVREKLAIGREGSATCREGASLWASLGSFFSAGLTSSLQKSAKNFDSTNSTREEKRVHVTVCAGARAPHYLDAAQFTAADRPRSRTCVSFQKHKF